MRKLLLSFVCVALLSGAASAADMPVKARPMEVMPSWAGFYLGAHAGYAWTTQDMSAADRAAIVATYGAVPSPKGFVGGVHGGYDWQLANRLVFGVALEVNGFGIESVTSTTGLPGSSLKSTIDWDIAPYARLGYAFDRYLPYVLAGVAFDHNSVRGFNGVIGAFSVSNWHTGWTVGAGVEAIIAAHWTARVQYRYVNSGSATYLNRSISGTGSLLDAGITYRF